MARIFYFRDTGKIYGVHHSPHENNPKIQLPQNVIWIDVPETADKIRWPEIEPGEPGTEHSSRVNPATKALEFFTVPPTHKRKSTIKKLNVILSNPSASQDLKDLAQAIKDLL